MRMFVVLTVICCSFAFIQPVSRPVIAQEKQAPVKWEYAELVYRGFAGRPAGKEGDGKPVEAIASTMTMTWTSSAGVYAVKWWGELAEKLKTPLKKDGVASQKIQMLNALGAEG